jgi:hypothetical protein
MAQQQQVNPEKLEQLKQMLGISSPQQQKPESIRPEPELTAHIWGSRNSQQVGMDYWQSTLYRRQRFEGEGNQMAAIAKSKHSREPLEIVKDTDPEATVSEGSAKQALEPIKAEPPKTVDPTKDFTKAPKGPTDAVSAFSEIKLSESEDALEKKAS